MSREIGSRCKKKKSMKVTVKVSKEPKGPGMNFGRDK